MKWLRNRIATSCALLLIGTVAIIAFISMIFFWAIIFNDRKELISRTTSDLISYIQTYGVPNSVERWSSRNTFIQINGRQPNGGVVPLVKSVGLGTHVIPFDPLLQMNGATRYQELLQYGQLMLRSDSCVTLKQKPVCVHVESALSTVDDTPFRMGMFVIILTVIAVPFVVLVSIFLARRAIQPIDNLIATMKQVNSEKLSQHIGLETRMYELGELARTFDAMLERLHASFERERRFIADASHELKTPLTVIHANAQMLRRWAQSDEAVRSESIEIIINESRGLSVFIEEMLLLARIDCGDDVAHDLVDLPLLCGELIHGLRARVGDKAIQVELNVYGEPQDFALPGNAVLLRRILSNLLDNALKFTQEGEITVGLTHLGDSIEIVVSDTGIGIPPDELEHVFERLYRSDHSRTRQVEGFGLGLSIAKAFVEIHHGRIYAHSRPGRGTSVYVHLPATESSTPKICAS